MLSLAEAEATQPGGHSARPCFERDVAQASVAFDQGLGIRATLRGDGEDAPDARHPRRPPVIIRRNAGDSLGSSVSRIPSPSRLNESTVTVMARPG